MVTCTCVHAHYICIGISMYGTNHTKVNVLNSTFFENAHEMDMGTGIPVLLFTLYHN